MVKMNFVKRYLMERELRELEYKIERHYALSVRKAELETTQSNVINIFCKFFKAPKLIADQLIGHMFFIGGNTLHFGNEDD